MLTEYNWPGNVRELRNVLERAMIFCRDSELDVARVLSVRGSSPNKELESTSSQSLEAMERQHILQMLEECGGRVEIAADRLGISRNPPYAKIKRYGVVARP